MAFNQSAAYQLGVCQLVLLVSLGIQVFTRPFMGREAFQEQLAAHLQLAAVSPLHARLEARLRHIEARGRRRTLRNAMTASGRLDVSAALSHLRSWLFDHNTVESTLLFAAAMVLRRLPGCTHGAMLVEFAVALPVLLTLYTGAYTLSDMIACQRKVTAATHQLTDLVARANTLAPDDVSGVLAASAQVLAPYAGARAAITVSEVQLTADGTARTWTWPGTVTWLTGTPTLSSTNGQRDLFVFWTLDGGTTWLAMTVAQGF